jgi:hypothetical protein
MQGLRTLNNRLRGYSSIEGRQLALMRVSECQQIAVGDMRGVEKTRRLDPFRVEQGYIVGPESVAGQFPERRQHRGHDRGRTGTIRISRMAHNAQNSIFRQRAARPRLMALCRKPVVRAIVQHMSGIDQGDQNVYVEKKSGHGSSSRSCCTSSEVTRLVPLRSLSSGTPFRLLALLSSGDSARRANEEITSPTDFFSTTAISLAALSTSSSITSVVRIYCVLMHRSITHHTSDASPATISIRCGRHPA